MSADKLVETPPIQPAHAVLAGGGETGALMRTIDWTTTFLGSPKEWPENLCSALSLCLNAQFPIAIYWGPERTLIYNDAWRPIAGNKHPWSMGRPAIEVWTEIWADIDPLFRKVFETGEGTFSKDQLLPMHRHGYTEECYFDFTFSPIKNVNGTVGGILNVVQETTYRVINDRRTELLREIASITSSGTSVEQVSKLAIKAISTDPQDIPFAVLYLLDSQKDKAYLADMTGLPAGSSASPISLALTANIEWPIAEVIQSGQAVLVEDLSIRFATHFIGFWPEAVQKALVLPITATGQTGISGILIAGISPRRALDQGYQDFYGMMAGHIAIAIANAQAYEAERKRAEALAEIDRAKTAFFSSVSHEFRTPLTLLLGPIEDALHHTETVPENRQRLELAHRNALRLQKLVNTLLDFSRIEAGRVQACYQPTDLATYTVDLASMFQSAIEKAGLILKLDCPPLPEPIYVDREMWEKIILNLLSNAFKHTFEGKISVSLDWTGKEARLTVEDSGIGIAADQLPHLFERFHRVPNAKSRTHEGSGIGLALVYELVKLHGGTIEVSSQVDKGTCFVIKLPAGKAHLPAERIEAESRPISSGIAAQSFVDEALRWLPGDGHPLSHNLSILHPTISREAWQTTTPNSTAKARIILADDNADMRSYVYSLLSLHCDVETVSNGIKALEAARRQPPDLIISDVMMPEMDGFELLEALRTDETLRTISVLLLSARAGEESKVEGLQAGADDYLTKPFNARELLARVKTNLELARIRKETEVTLRESEERFRTMADVSQILISTSDETSKATYFNQAWINITGRSMEDLLNFGWVDLLHPEDRDRYFNAYQAAFNKQEGFNDDFRLLRHDGQYRWIIAFCAPRFQLDKTFVGYISSCVDVTEGKQAEQALKKSLKREKLIAGIIDSIRSETKLDTILAQAVRRLGELTDADRCVIWPYDPENNSFKPAFEYRRENILPVGNTIFPDSPVLPFSLSCTEAVVISDISKAEKMTIEDEQMILERGIKSLLHVPICYKDTMLGLLRVHAIKEQHEWDDDTVSIVKYMAAQVAVAMHNATILQNLTINELRKSAILQASLDAVITIDSTGNILEWNQGAEKTFGYFYEEVLGKPMCDFIMPDRYKEAHIQGIERYLATGESQILGQRIELPACRKGGVEFPAEISIAPIRTDGKIMFTANLRDITERKQFEQELKESELRFRNLADTAPMYMAMADETGNAIYFNKPWLEFTGKNLDEMKGLGWLCTLHPEDVAKFERDFKNAFDKHIPINEEYRFRRADGEYRWMMAVGAARFTPDGRFIGYFGTYTDFHDQKQAQIALKESEERYRLVVEGTSDGIWDWDIETGKTYWSDRYFDILGLPKNEGPVSYEAWIERVHPDDRENVRELLKTHLEKYDKYEYEFRISHSSGEYRYCISHGELIRNDQGHPIRMLGTITDFTERKRAEIALQKAFERERLTRRVAELSNQGLELDHILNTLAKEIGEFFQVDRAFVIHLEHVDETYHVNTYSQFCRAEEICAYNPSGMSSKLQEFYSWDKSIDTMMALIRVSTPEEYARYSREYLDKHNLSTEEKEALYQEIIDLNIGRERMRAMLRLPIIYRGIPYGNIVLHQCISDRLWTDDEVAILQEVATQIGTIFYQAEISQKEKQAKEALQDNLGREYLIRKVVEIIGQSFDINQILRTVAQELGHYLQVDRASVSRYWTNKGRLTLDASAQYTREGIRPFDNEDIELLIKAVQHLTPEAITKDEPQITNINNQQAYIEYMRERMGQLDLPDLPTEKLIEMVYKYEIQSSLRVSIRYRGIPYGSISVSQTSYNRQWQSQEVELLKTIAEHAGSAIYQTELYRQEQRAREEAEMRLKRESLMRRIVEIINEAQEVTVILKLVAQELGLFLRADRAVLMHYTAQEENLKLMVSAQYCADETIQPLSDEDIGLIVKTIQHISPELLEEDTNSILNMQDVRKATSVYHERFNRMQVSGMSADDFMQMVQRYEIKSVLRVGVFYRGIAYGSVALHQCAYFREWQPEEIELLHSITNQLGIALNQAELYRLEKQARQEAEEANRKKSEFLAMMSHELRTPLNSIIGYSRMIENGMGGPLTNNQAKYIGNVSSSGNHLLNIVNDLLDVSKAEAGKMRISPSLIDIKPIVDDVHSMVKEFAFKKNVSLDFYIEPDAETIEVDPARFKQILINLVNNAIKFNRNGGAVWVRFYRAKNRTWIIGEIEDTGIGIPAEKQKELFNKFYQVDNSASRPQEGTGLGLALSKELIELHGGEISVASEQGLGTTFRFNLPASQKLPQVT